MSVLCGDKIELTAFQLMMLLNNTLEDYATRIKTGGELDIMDIALEETIGFFNRKREKGGAE